MRRCTPNFRATPITDPTPNSYSRRICSYSSTLALQSNSPSASHITEKQGRVRDAQRWANLNRQTGPDQSARIRKHQAVKILRLIPLIGPLRAALLLALMQTPHRFRSKRQLWTYSGLGVETHDSAQHRYVDGQLQRSQKPQNVRGLNHNHNHAMKDIFKSTAMSASHRAGPFQDFYASLLAKGMKPEMAQLTLARKIAAITLTLWKKGGRFDAKHLKPQAA